MEEPVDNVNAEPLQQEGNVNNNINENGNDGNNNENGIANIDNIEEAEEVEEEEEDDGNANPDNAAAADEENENGNDANEGGNGVIDGGVAGESGEDGRSTSCDLVLLIKCTETLPFAPSHPIFRSGVTVSIGLDKNTKLCDVFGRYCRFVNSHAYDPVPPSTQTHLEFEPTDLDFTHCSILHAEDTAETSALMKNDKINVCTTLASKRQIKAEQVRLQRESDRDYFQQMRHLLPDLTSSLKCDIIFHCRGKITDENGYKQEVLTTYVKGHSSILAKRCNYLRQRIQLARENFLTTTASGNDSNASQNENVDDSTTVKDNSNGNANEYMNPHAVTIPEHERDNNSDVDAEEEDDGIRPIQPNPNVHLPRADAAGRHDQEGEGRNINLNHHPLANEVEDEDEDFFSSRLRNNINVNDSAYSLTANAVPIDSGNEHGHNSRTNSPVAASSSHASRAHNALVVPLLHPPEAVKLLLEYCYTNRVISLGSEAFNKSFKTPDPHKIFPEFKPHCGPISPFKNTRGSKSSWPDKGHPTISLPIALAGIQLAEEAHLPRLSLMCEVAASLLLSPPNVLEALALCESQNRLTGNHLPLLRKAVMRYHIFSHGPRGVDDLSSMPSFQGMLHKRKDLVVPSLMMGTMEVVKDVLGDKDFDDMEGGADVGTLKRGIHIGENTKRHFDELDEDDVMKRAKERLRWRKERWSKRPRYLMESMNPYGLEEGNEGMFRPTSIMLNDEGEVDPEKHNRYFKRLSHHSGNASVVNSNYNFRDRPGSVGSVAAAVGSSRSGTRSRRRR